MIIRRLLFTAFFTGYFPVAPGTVATVLAAAIYVAEYFIFGRYGWIVNVLAVILMVYPSVVLCGEGEEYFGEKDPQQVVLDELMGYWVSVMFHPFSWTLAFAAFFFFRIADIAKPFPAGRLQRLKGGMGILIDDIVAGVYANLAVTVLLLLTGVYEIPWPL